ncbi:hypothetical protein DSO57_1007976 [Entomophthora muscae]|uniref:Uncharacterized protein n=1 Tax=Entomophthora muscae TaxID=34485 RepID=A0ACC2TIJ1_9FUNG|nr:hypothetical protein DSO57_1007976 [Entomophthora muscae]
MAVSLGLVQDASHTIISVDERAGTSTLRPTSLMSTTDGTESQSSRTSTYQSKKGTDSTLTEGFGMAVVLMIIVYFLLSIAEMMLSKTFQ